MRVLNDSQKKILVNNIIKYLNLDSVLLQENKIKNQNTKLEALARKVKKFVQSNPKRTQLEESMPGVHMELDYRERNNKDCLTWLNAQTISKH